MSFLNPWLLFGIGAVAVPIIIHLLMKRQLKRVVWAAMRFLQASVQRNEKRLRIENLLLLLLRCALLILLALALARPALHSLGLGVLAPPGSGSETAVIAIDNSYSMCQSDGVSSRFDNARKAAQEIVDSLPPGSSAAVLLVSDVVQALIPEPTLDLALVRKTIKEAALSSRGTDLQPAFHYALELLKSRAGNRKAIYLLTDGQANGWTHAAEIHALLQGAKLEVQAYVVLTGTPEDRNLGVSELRLAGALSPARQAVRFEVQVTNYGTAEAKNVPVSLAVDNDEPCDEGAIESIAPGASKSLSLFANFRDPGFRTVTARLPADRVPADDRRTLALSAFEQARVLLVDGNPGTEPRDSEVFYLRNALTPVPSAQQAEYFIKTDTIAPADFDSAKLDEYDVVVLANAPDLSATAPEALDRYLRRGGGLIVFPGDKIDVAFYDGKLPFLPAKFGAVYGDDTRYFTLHSKDYEHPIVSIWKDPASGSLDTAHFHRAFELKIPARQRAPTADGKAQPDAPRVVVPFADGQPAFVERTWGLGRVVQFASTAGTAWNDLPVRPVFVPLIHRVLGALVNRRSERLNVPVGGRFTYLCEPELLGKPVTVVKPVAGSVAVETGTNADAAADRSARTRPGRVELVNGEPMLRFDETELAGAYEVNVAGDPPLTLKFAAQASPEESKLAEFTQFDSLSPLRVMRRRPNENLRERIARERGGTEIWFPLAILALVVACTETMLAARFSRSK